jgi:type VI secretion system protein ImpF
MSKASDLVLPSVLNRLVDVSMGSDDRRSWYDVEELIGVVRDDLEGLLNTRQTMVDIAQEYPGLEKSILGYGVPDPSCFALETPTGRRRYANCLVAIITCFEPRLHSIRVDAVADASGEKFRELRFRISGRLAVDSAPRVVFESTLHIPSGQYRIEKVG